MLARLPAAAIAAAAALLLSAERLCAAEDAEPKPWEIFDDFVSRMAATVIGGSAFPRSEDGQMQDLAQARQALAMAIVTAILNERDDRTHKLVSSLNIGTTSTVWDVNIPQEYKGLVTYGIEGPLYPNKPMRWISQGASVHHGCTNVDLQRLPEYGSLGYPCPHGSAVHLHATTQTAYLLNCVVFYYPIGFIRHTRSHASIKCMRGHYIAALEAVWAAPRHSRLRDPSSPDNIRLNNIAADFSRALAAKGNYVVPSAFRFKVVLVLPVYENTPGRPHQRGIVREWLSESVGLAAVGGQFMIDHMHIPMAIDLNGPPGPGPLVLYVLAALPEPALCD